MVKFAIRLDRVMKITKIMLNISRNAAFSFGFATILCMNLQCYITCY